MLLIISSSSSSSSSKPLFKEGKTHNSIYILINLWPSIIHVIINFTMGRTIRKVFFRGGGFLSCTIFFVNISLAGIFFPACGTFFWATRRA